MQSFTDASYMIAMEERALLTKQRLFKRLMCCVYELWLCATHAKIGNFEQRSLNGRFWNALESEKDASDGQHFFFETLLILEES